MGTSATGRRILAAVVTSALFLGAFVLLLTAFAGVNGAERSDRGAADDQRVSSAAAGGPAVLYSVLVGSGNSGNPEIFVADASGMMQLTDYGGADHSPSWSPDGTQVAFVSDRDDPGNLDIYVMNADGSGVRRITTDEEVDAHPAWSPDGAQLAYQRSDGKGHWELFIIGVDGSGERQITRNNVSDESPAWSPDGTQLAFERFVGTNLEIFVMDVDGTSERQVTNLPGQDHAPVWSPDGKAIAFSRDADEDGTSDVWTVDVAGGEATQVTNGVNATVPVGWAADGLTLFFQSETRGAVDVVAVRLSSSALDVVALPPQARTALASGYVFGADVQDG